jgi:hypothetical protein
MILHSNDVLRTANYEFRNDLDRYTYERVYEKLLSTIRQHGIRNLSIPLIWVTRVTRLVSDMIAEDPNIRIFEISDDKGLLKVTYLSDSRLPDEFEKFREMLQQAQIDTHKLTMDRVDLMLCMEGK